jgi:glutamine amidotransferase
MCRLLAFRTKGSIDKKFVEALIKSAENDIYSRYGKHPHGWGLIVLINKNSTWRSIYYRSQIPIYEDPNVILLTELLKGDEIIGMFHVRRASKDFLLGSTHNHPYYSKIGEKDVYFAHNGSVKREVFRNRDLQLTDSYLVFMEIIENMKFKDPLNSIKEVVNRLGPYSTSLNSALLIHSEKSEPELYFTHYYNKARARDIDEYYRIYEINGYVFSSTLKYYLNIDARALELGEILTL